MSNLKYKSSNSTNTTNTSTQQQQPIWCSLSTPSQIARKYASIAPIWCHISRPRQLKKKFASTFHQAQSLLSRQHSSKDPGLSSSTRNLTTTSSSNSNSNNNNNTSSNIEADDSDEMSHHLKHNNNSHDTADILNGNGTNYKSAWTNGGGGGIVESSNDSFNDMHRSSMRKRDSSLDIKRKTEKLLATDLSSVQTPSSNNSYLYNNMGMNRWPTSSTTTTSSSSTTKPISKQPYTFNKEIYDTSSSSGGLSSNYVGTTYHIDDNTTIPASTSVNIDGLSMTNIPSTISSNSSSSGGSRRPNKYNPSKYLSSQQQSGSGGSKTEKIVSKSSKSSPNLLAKDYDHFYTDRYGLGDTSTSKWHHPYTSSGSSNTTSSTSNNNPYHSSINPYYGNYSSSYFQPQTTSTSTNSNNDHYNYNSSSTTNSNREDKWNELDSMLGAQSALLSRLESDFVANRKKSQPGSLNTTTTGASSSSYNPINTNRYSSSSSQLLAKLPSNNSVHDIDTSSSYVPSRYRTPKKTLKYTSKIDENEAEPLSTPKKVNNNISEEDLVLYNNTTNNSNPSYYNSTKKYTFSTKTEPIIDLIKSLGLKEDEEEETRSAPVPTEQTSEYNKKLNKKSLSSEKETPIIQVSSVLDSLNKNVIESLNKSTNELMRSGLSNKQHCLNSGVSSTSIENMDSLNDDLTGATTNSNTNDFVDDFINDYLNNSLNNNNSVNDLNGDSQTGSNNSTSNNHNTANSGPIDIINKKNTSDSNSDSATPFVTPTNNTNSNVTTYNNNNNNNIRNNEDLIDLDHNFENNFDKIINNVNNNHSHKDNIIITTIIPTSNNPKNNNNNNLIENTIENNYQIINEPKIDNPSFNQNWFVKHFLFV